MKTLLFVAVVSLLLTFIKNKSNFPSEIMIPLIAALFTKYILGDWDKGYRWTVSDVYYWTSIIFVSYLVVVIQKKIQR